MPIFTYFVPSSLTVDPRREPGLNVSAQLNPGGNSSSFRVNDRPSFSPFKITDPVSTKTLFKGSVATFTDEFEENVHNEVHGISAIDSSWIFNKYRPFGKYVSTSLSTVVVDLVGKYALDFTTAHVQTNLPKITITFTGEETLDQAITRAVQLAGDCRWYKDFDQDVHVFHVNPPSLPVNPLRAGPANPLVPTESASLIVGPGGPGTGSFAAGTFLVSYSWEYDDGVVSDYSPWAVVDLDGAHQQQIDSIAVGSAFGGHNVVARRVWLAYFSGFWGGGYPGYGMEHFVPFSYFRVPNNTTTSVTANYGGYGQDIAGVWSAVGTYSFNPTTGHAITLRIPSNDGPVSAATITAGGTITTGGPGGGSVTWTAGIYALAYSYVYADGQESLLSPLSANFTTDGAHALSFAGVTVGPNRLDGTPVIARKIYWQYLTFTGGTPGAPIATGWMGHGIVSNNVTTTFAWTDTFGHTPALKIWTAFYGTPRGVEDNPGTNPEDTDGNNPDTVTDSSPLLLKDPPFKVTYDKTQIRNRVFVRGASVAAIAPAAIGVQTVSVPTGHPFRATGGKVFVGSKVYDYDATTATSIHLSQALTTAVVVGDIVGIWTQQDDAEAQAWLAEQEDGDGVHEFTVVDTALTTVDQINQRAFAELALFARPIITAEYSTRDPKSQVGRLVVYDMANPPLSAILLIQSVNVDQYDETTNDTLAPRFRVKASSVRFTLDDLFRNVALLNSGGAASTGTVTGGSGGGGGGGGGGGAASANVFGETPTGAVNGANAVFTTAHAYFRATLRVFVNGIRQKPANVTETSATTFTLATAPTTGDELVVDYVY